MKPLITTACEPLASFFGDDEGAQVVEYALIIAVVSIALVIALQLLVPDADFATFIGRVSTCLTSAICL
jgi:pilus assembly protein Flp/PilA